MPLMYPKHDDPALQEISNSIGHVILASGRAWHAVRNIVYYRLSEDEAATEQRMIGINATNITGQITLLCASHYPVEALMRLTDHCERLALLYAQRNRLVHDEWWIWPGENGSRRQLVLRQVERKTGEEKHDENWTAERLEKLASDLADVSDDLNLFGYIPKG